MQRIKPFLKWVGGKSRLLPEINSLVRKFKSKVEDWQTVDYIEPFVGGGAVFFNIFNELPNLGNVHINDENTSLMITYQTVKSNLQGYIDELQRIEDEYLPLSIEERINYYYRLRHEYNYGYLSNLKIATLFTFLNKTGYNGLYRVNQKGYFNVPAGRYKNPKLCDELNLKEVSCSLRFTKIHNSDFYESLKWAKFRTKTLFYFDPPYRELSKTSKFKSYTESGFTDKDQVRLKELCDDLNERGYHFILSNSNTSDGYFQKLYSKYQINEVNAARSINCDPDKRGKISELLITNIK